MTQPLTDMHAHNTPRVPTPLAPPLTAWLAAILGGLALVAPSSSSQAQENKVTTKVADSGHTATPATATPPVTTTPAAIIAPTKPPEAGHATHEGDETGSPTAGSPAKQQSKDDGGCFPGCRDGYLCHEKQCISACNPACGEGLQCFEGRQCVPANSPVLYPSGVAPRYMPWPAQPAGGRNMPPPPGAWRPAYEEPVTPGDARGQRGQNRGPRFFGYLGLQLGLGGAGRVKLVDKRPGYYAPIGEPGFDLTSSTGFEGVTEFRISRYFGLGPALRLFRANANNGIGHTNNLDLLVVPTFHIPLNAVEIFFPIPVGFSFGGAPSDLPADYTSTLGVTAGINVGMLAWLSKGLGMYAQFGMQAHFRELEVGGVDYNFNFRRPTLTLGLSLRD